MSTTTQIKLCGRMTFPGGADRERIEKVSNFHNAVAILLFQEQLGKERLKNGFQFNEFI